jgi:hypothetical protein
MQTSLMRYGYYIVLSNVRATVGKRVMRIGRLVNRHNLPLLGFARDGLTGARARTAVYIEVLLHRVIDGQNAKFSWVLFSNPVLRVHGTHGYFSARAT